MHYNKFILHKGYEAKVPMMCELIDRLVFSKVSHCLTVNSQIATAMEAESTDAGLSKPKRKAKNNEVAVEVAWQQLANESLYLLEVEIQTGVQQSVAIAGSDIGLDSKLVEGLVGGYRSKISKELLKLRSKLESAQKAFYRELTIYANPFRFVREESLSEAITRIEDLQLRAEEYCKELSNDYSNQVASFLIDIKELLEAALPEGEPERTTRIEQSLIGYAESFPPLEAFESALTIAVKGPIKLNNLAAQLKTDKILQTELANEEKRSASARLEAQRLEAQYKAEKLLQDNLLNAFESSKETCLEEGYELIGSFLDRTDVRQAGGLTNRDKDALTTLFRRLELLASHTPKLQPVVEEATQLRVLYGTNNADPEEVQNAVERFQNFLLTQTTQAESNSAGLQKLARSLAFSKDYKLISAELERLVECPDPERLSELEGKIWNNLDVLKLRQSKLKSLFKSAQKAAEEVSKPKSKNDPYDSVAGF